MGGGAVFSGLALAVHNCDPNTGAAEAKGLGAPGQSGAKWQDPVKKDTSPRLFTWPSPVCVYRWLGYLGLLLLDVIICLLVLVGLIRSSKGILVG